MALASLSGTQNYYDGDGLLRVYGTDKAVAARGGEFKTYGELRTIDFRIDLTKLTSTAQIVDDQVFFPKSMFVEEVVLDVQTAATSAGSPTLDVGLVQASDRTTVISQTSFIAAEVLSGKLDTAGTKVVYTAGVSKAGALIGTTASSTLVGQVIARANTATFTAGVVTVRIKYRYPVT